jgi:hypothetical protein
MAAYSYKNVVYRGDFEAAKKRWEEANGECDGDSNYDGHNWLIAAQLLDEKDARIAELEAKLAELQPQRDDALRAMRLASRVTLDTQTAEEAMAAVLALLDEARETARTLAEGGCPHVVAAGQHDAIRAAVARAIAYPRRGGT